MWLHFLQSLRVLSRIFECSKKFSSIYLEVIIFGHMKPINKSWSLSIVIG